MEYGLDEVSKLVQDSLKENISLKSFDKILHLIEKDSAKSNSVSKSVFLSIPKNNKIILVYMLSM